MDTLSLVTGAQESSRPETFEPRSSFTFYFFLLPLRKRERNEHKINSKPSKKRFFLLLPLSSPGNRMGRRNFGLENFRFWLLDWFLATSVRCRRCVCIPVKKTLLLPEPQFLIPNFKPAFEYQVVVFFSNSCTLSFQL